MQIHEIGRDPGGGSLVIGEVVHLHIEDALLIGEDKIDIEALRPVGRLAGGDYCRVNEIIHLPRPISPQ